MMRFFGPYRHRAFKLFLIVSLCLVFGYCIRGLWIKGILIEKKARLLSEFLDQSFSRLGLKPEDLSRHFYEERRVGIKKFVHTTKIFNLPDAVSPDTFYQAILGAVQDSNARLLEKTNFEIGDYSISVFVLGRPSISTHLLIGVKKISLQPEPEKKAKKKLKRNKIAIIIDDLGYNTKIINYIREIKVPITLAVLPKLSFSQEVAEKGYAMGCEIILHLPLEPENEIECLGPGAIFLKMAPPEIENILDEDLKTVPHCRGINNHAGSRFTMESHKMEILLEMLKERELFFVDSLVTPDSVGFRLASELGIPTASRDIFLDNIIEEEYILNQLKALVELSHRKGKAIGIGHPSQTTFKVLKENLTRFEESIEFVYVSELLK